MPDTFFSIRELGGEVGDTVWDITSAYKILEIKGHTTTLELLSTGDVYSGNYGRIFTRLEKSKPRGIVAFWHRTTIIKEDTCAAKPATNPEH